MDIKPLLILGLVGAILAGGVYVSKINREQAFLEAGVTTTTVGQTAPTAVDRATGSAKDWEAGLARINKIENELFQNPNAARVNEIMLPACPCHQDTTDRLKALKAKGHKVAGANIVLKNTTFIKQDSDTRVSVYTFPTSAGFGIIDSQGKIVEGPPPQNPKGFMYVLDKDRDGTWRLADRYMIGTRQ